MVKALPAFACLGSILASSMALGQQPGPKPAIRVRLSHPDQQLREVIGLFKTAKAADPASALAAWKRASTEPNRLGKPLEALIASFNPRMVGELKSLEAAEVSIRFDPETGRPDWSATLPEDDGTFAALATALALSGGAAEAPMGDVAVDRLAGPGSPLMAKVPGGTLLACDRGALQDARDELERTRDLRKGRKADPGGLHVSIEPGSLGGSRNLTMKRIGEMVRPTGGLVEGGPRPIEFGLSMDGDGLLARVACAVPGPIRRATVDPSWLDWTPKGRAMVGFAMAADPAPKSWDGWFAIADRIEKLDPSRVDVASLRLRLDLAARLMGIRAEEDVLRHLRGVSGWVGSNGREVDAAFVAIHLDDQSAAGRIISRLKPIPGPGPPAPDELGRPRSLGRLEGRPLRVSRVERAVVLAWGEGVLEASTRARDDRDGSAGPEIRRSWRLGSNPIFAGVLWPGRISAAIPAGSPLAIALDEAPPVTCQAYVDGTTIHGFATWPDLDKAVGRFLDQIPLDPPPDQ